MKQLFLVTFFIFLQGCATTKALQPVGGSKADGTVTLAYEYNAFENPQIDWNLAKATARVSKNRYFGQNFPPEKWTPV